MRLNYSDLILEPPDELARLERQYRSSPVADRLKMLRLLQSGAYPSRTRLAPVLGYTPRQLQRWWSAYQQGGLDLLLARITPGGSRERITPEAWAALEQQMTAGHIAGLKDAQRFLEAHFSIRYTVGGLSDLFRRRKTKRKTGRRRHQKASAEEQAAWKKKVPGGGREATPGALLRRG